uniref:Head-tail joining protein n=1 Tax=viral metagenome TaxID=1070528 RepID=A0A6M3JRF6_9ZZZZ
MSGTTISNMRDRLILEKWIGTAVTINHKYTDSDGKDAWGGVGHTDDEYARIRALPFTITAMEDSRYSPPDREAVFRSDSTVAEDDEVIIGASIYRVESPTEPMNFAAQGQTLAYLKYIGVSS